MSIEVATITRVIWPDDTELSVTFTDDSRASMWVRQYDALTRHLADQGTTSPDLGAVILVASARGWQVGTRPNGFGTTAATFLRAGEQVDSVWHADGQISWADLHGRRPYPVGFTEDANDVRTFLMAEWPLPVPADRD